LHKLRPNRTIEARDRLRKLIVVSSSIGIASFVILAPIICYMISVHVINVRTYLHNYPGCSPEFEQQLSLKGNPNQLPEWSVNFVTTHQYVAFLGDIIENVIIWVECGIIACSSMPVVVVLNYDLYLYWWHVDKQIEETLRLVLLNGETSVLEQGSSRGNIPLVYTQN
jgi:hypothetical protein